MKKVEKGKIDISEYIEDFKKWLDVKGVKLENATSSDFVNFFWEEEMGNNEFFVRL